MNWGEQYLLTALRINNVYRSNHDVPYLDAYHGPQELLRQAEEEGPRTPAQLREDTDMLRRGLLLQGYTPERHVYLEKQITAMEAAVRTLEGERGSLVEEARSFLDLELHPIPDTVFAEGLRMINDALPGKGTVAERYEQWQSRVIRTVSPEQRLSLIQHGVEEASSRTRERFPLPALENVEVRLVTQKAYGAANWYQGNYHSLMEYNADRPLNLFSLLPLICHEGYPGHHTEYSLKEEQLLANRGYLDAQVFITLSPQLVLTEGIAEAAFDMIFTPEEAAEWMRKHIMEPLDIDCREVDLPLLIQGARRIGPDQVSGNLAFLHDAGFGREELLAYGMRYTLQPEAVIAEVIEQLSHSRFYRLYLLSYSHGKRLIEQYLNGKESNAAFYCLLTEQWAPSQLREAAGGKA